MPSPDESARYSLPSGLTPAEVETSRARYGANVLTPPARDPWWRLYLAKFNDPIIRILVIAAVVALLVGLYDGHYVEGIGIVIAILLSTGLSFLNEYRAEREFDVLNQVSDEDGVTVIREGKHTVIPKRDVVVDDIVTIEQGNEIPADGEVLEAVSLMVNESSLTGESVPVAKRPASDDRMEEADKAYASQILLRGTAVADGHGVFLVTAVGDATEIGKTARAASEKPDTATPLSKQLERLAGLISIGAFLAAAVIFIGLTIRGAHTGEIFDYAVVGGRLAQVPLNGGQWWCFFLLAVVLVILGAQVWAPTFRQALGLIHKENLLPEWVGASGWQTFSRLALVALAVCVVGVVPPILVGALSFDGEAWLPFSALGAFLRYFMVAVTVIVVAVPEGLPMCVTLALAYSMRKMTATNNLVRKMHACETIGAASVICSDKTGTLTMNEMRVHQPVFPFLEKFGMARDNPLVNAQVEAVCANSTAHLELGGDKPKVIGNPTEGALLLWLNSEGREYEAVRHAFDIRQQLTFSTERKFMATAGVSAVTGQPTLFVKGATEVVLARTACLRLGDGSIIDLDDEAKEKILVDAANFQKRGMRIIGFASREVPAASLAANIEELVAEGGLVWDGFIAISDPIRPDAPAAIQAALNAGIKIKIVTGDNQTTAKEIARQAGLWQAADTPAASTVTGDAFAAMPDGQAMETAGRIKIMSRARPLNKLRLVKLLQDRGEVVAVTGDGTNDAPALNHADVGLAMGKTGTSVAKEASDIILLDDSFQSIVNAVSWGRSLYANIQKFIVFQLIINVAAVGIALLGPFLGVALPLTVTQMLWINLIMDTFAALALASEPPDWGLMKERPRAANAFIITPHMKNAILTTGGIFLGLFLVVILGLRSVFPLDAATFEGRHNLTLFFTGFVLLQFWNLINARVFNSERSAFSGLAGSKAFLLMAAVILLGQILLVSWGGEMFRVTPMTAGEWVVLLVITSPALWVGEFLRYNRRLAKRPGYWVYS